MTSQEEEVAVCNTFMMTNLEPHMWMTMKTESWFLKRPMRSDKALVSLTHKKGEETVYKGMHKVMEGS